MPPESDSRIRDLQCREIRRILAAGRPAWRRLRPLDLVMLALIAGQLLAANLEPPAAAGPACPAPAERWHPPD